VANAIRQWRERLAALGARDRQALAGLAILLMAMLGYFGLLRPAAENYTAAKVALAEQRALLTWLQDNERRLRGAVPSVAPAAAGGETEQSLLARISASASAHDIAIARLEPNAGGVRAAIDATDFSRLITWLDELNRQHKVSVSEAVIERLAADRGVSARLQLNSPGK